MKTGSGDLPDNKEEERMSSVTAKPAQSTPRYVAKDRYVTWTTNESLRFDQSIDDKVKYGDSKAKKEISPSQMVGEAVGEGASSRRSRRKAKKFSSSSGREGFPPLLSTLNRYGRPRYDFVRRIENGRLQIQMVPNERPELVAIVHDSGRLMLSFFKCENQDCQDDDDEVQEGCIGTVKDHEESNYEVEMDGSCSGGDKEEEVHRGGAGKEYYPS